MNPFTALKKPSSFRFTSLYIYFFFTYPINPSLHFILLFMSTTHFPSLHFPSFLVLIAFTTPVFTFLTLVLKICVLPWEIPIVPSGSRFQSVMDLFTKEYFPMSVLGRVPHWLKVQSNLIYSIFYPRLANETTIWKPWHILIHAVD